MVTHSQARVAWLLAAGALGVLKALKKRKIDIRNRPNKY